MAFTRETNITKVGIEDQEIEFFVPGPSNTEGVQAGDLSAQILKSDGSIEVKKYDLIERLGDDPAGQTHLANLIALKDYITARLNAEVLPLP